MNKFIKINLFKIIINNKYNKCNNNNNNNKVFSFMMITILININITFH